ncbi:RING/U-box superfamily protein [Prunus dulcis]|uniref:RING/U-box superfamily protein n=1 Tax=Prunus dulcis TaxID=3755 RepID=A0A4Y1R4W4_PRUDU|nr:RING/U-box superfamily protein [Prunus dulcis]
MNSVESKEGGGFVDKVQMDVPCPEPNSDAQSDQFPLLLEQMESPNDHVHIIDVTRNRDTSASSSSDDRPPRVDLPQHEDRPSASTHAPTYQAASSSSNRLNSRNSSFMRRGDGYSRHRRSPLNSGLWISVELVVTVSQIIASIVVLSLSTNEHPQAPLFAWVVGYASGCVATLPILYWRFRNRNRGAEQESIQSHQGSSESNPPEPMSYTAISISQASDEENNRTSDTVTNNPHIAGPLSASEVKKLENETNNDHECNLDSEGGLLGAGTEKERAISGEDACFKEDAAMTSLNMLERAAVPRHWPETRTSSRVREMGSADDIVYESTGFILNSQMVKPQLGWFVEVQEIPYCFTEEPLTTVVSGSVMGTRGSNC